MSQVFISYRRNDRQFVSELENRLTASELTVWTDRHIQPGENWENSIDEAIKRSFALLLVMTPNARLSEYVTYEWSFAMGLGILIIPLMLVQMELHPKLHRIQYLDFTVRYGEPWDELIQRLKLMQSDYKPPLIQQTVNDALVEFIDDLASDDADRQTVAAQTLGNMKASEAVPYLVKATSSQYESTRISSARALAQIGDQAAIPYLFRMINNNQKREIKQAAIEALGGFETEEVIRYLENIVFDRKRLFDGHERYSAVQALCTIQERQEHGEIRHILDRFHTRELQELRARYEYIRRDDDGHRLFERIVHEVEVYREKYGFMFEYIEASSKMEFLDFEEIIFYQYRQIRQVHDALESFTHQYDSQVEPNLSAQIQLKLSISGFVPINYYIKIDKGEIAENDFGNTSRPDVVITMTADEFRDLIQTSLGEGLLNQLIDSSKITARDTSFGKAVLRLLGIQ